MKDTASTAQREQNQRQGLIVGAITLPFRLLGVLIGSLLFSIVVECVGMHLFWKDQGWRHSQQMLQYELGHLSSHFTRSVVVQEPGRTAHELVDTGYEWVFVRSGLLERMSQTAERARAPSHGRIQDGGRNFRYYISQVYVWTESYLIAAAFTTLTFLVRLLVLVLTLPLILTAAFVGLIDGLVRRDVRRFGAGREFFAQCAPGLCVLWRECSDAGGGSGGVIADAQPSAIGEHAGKRMRHRGKFQPVALQFFAVGLEKRRAGKQRQVHRRPVMAKPRQGQLAGLDRAASSGGLFKDRHAPAFGTKMRSAGQTVMACADEYRICVGNCRQVVPSP